MHRAWKPKESPLGGEEKSLKTPRISALASSGEEKRRSIEMIVYDAYAS